MSIRTTADLRTLLLRSIDLVMAKEMEPKQAQAVCNLSKEIIKTADLELKARMVAHDVGEDRLSHEPLLLTVDED